MRARLIPVLTVDRERRLVKTVGFDARTYVGDPFNALRLFNEKEVDEIVVLDIDATVDGRAPDAGFIHELASECFMPLAYGGGLTDVPTCETLARGGVERMVLGSSANDLRFVTALAASLGSQAVVGCVDYRGEGATASVWTASGTRPHADTPAERAKVLAAAGCGELIVQSIDRDGQRTGCDLVTLRALSAKLTIPLIALGGAGEYDHLAAALDAGASAAASASAFTFIGRLRAVLLHYPDPAWIDALGGERAA